MQTIMRDCPELVQVSATCDVWCVTCDVCDVWRVTCDVWRVTHAIWQTIRSCVWSSNFLIVTILALDYQFPMHVFPLQVEQRLVNIMYIYMRVHIYFELFLIFQKNTYICQNTQSFSWMFFCNSHSHAFCFSCSCDPGAAEEGWCWGCNVSKTCQFCYQANVTPHTSNLKPLPPFITTHQTSWNVGRITCVCMC